MGTNTQTSARSRVSSRRTKAAISSNEAKASRRTTITLSPEAQEIVERFKSASGTSTSAAIDRIIQASEPRPSRLKEVNGFLVLDVPPDRPVVHFTLEDLKRAEDEMDREYVERLLPANRRAAAHAKGNGRRR
jgi:hypothetical protein